MHANLKRIAIALAFVSLGTAGLTTTGQAKTTWHKGIPKAIRGRWATPKGKKQKVGDYGTEYGFIITKNSMNLAYDKSQLIEPGYSGSGPAYHYHHKKGSKYYYTKSPLFYTAFGDRVEYKWFKVDGKKLSVNYYGEVRSEIRGNRKNQSFGKFHKLPKHVTTWYKVQVKKS